MAATTMERQLPRLFPDSGSVFVGVGSGGSSVTGAEVFNSIGFNIL